MTFLANPQFFSAASLSADLSAFLASKRMDKGWTPAFVTLHNTAVPTLAQWMDPSHPARQRVQNQIHYERDIQHWHSGVHWFVAPDGVWNVCDVEYDGVHCSCYNHVSFGVEMIGDYATESFTEGPGMRVRDNTVVLLAALHARFGWRPDPLVVGHAGLHMHYMCARDHHQCPGKGVVRADVVQRVQAAMAATPTA